MIGRSGLRFTRLQRSYEKRWRRLEEKRIAAWVSLRKKFGLLSRKDSVLFVGYAEAALGLGESFRNMLRALDSAGMPFAIYPFSKDAESRLIGPFLDDRYDRDGVYDINVVYMQVNKLPYYYSELRKQLTGARYNILRTYWELAEAPLAWGALLEPIDELWVPNSFVADAFRRIFDRTITVVPVCINVDRKRRYGRRHFGLDDRRFTFLFSFDYYSASTRKNPLGVVQAFQYAFLNQEIEVSLLIKSTGPKELDATASQQLENLSTLDPRITIWDQSLSRDEMLSLIDNCDCYISLHRSEGFGLGMAEALALGKPVIATDYSGNRDFLTADTGFPVPFSLRKLMPGEYPMGEGQSWAEPDLRVAIEQMRAVFANREERQTRAARGERYIEEHYSGEIVAKIVQDRLDDIRGGKDFLQR